MSCAERFHGPTLRAPLCYLVAPGRGLCPVVSECIIRAWCRMSSAPPAVDCVLTGVPVPADVGTAVGAWQDLQGCGHWTSLVGL